MSIVKHIFKKGAVIFSLLSLALAVLVTPAYAWSSSSYTPILPGTSDDIQTNNWLGHGDIFNFQSSSYLYGTKPHTAYLIQDSEYIQVNGISVSLSLTGGSASLTPSSATFICASYNNWYCGNVGYNERQSGIIWNTTSTDTTKVVIYPGGQAYYNQTGLTKWD